MMSAGSGGLAAVSLALPWWVLLIVLAIVVLGGIKLLKFVWLMFK
jgi:hypothetical protein